MNALEAAIQVLAQTGEELSKQEIAKRAIESGIWNSSGKTPYETIGSQIYTDIKKHGDDSRFILVRPGVFKLKHPQEVQLSLLPLEEVADKADKASPAPKAPAKHKTAAAKTTAPKAAAPKATAPAKQPEDSSKTPAPKTPAPKTEHKATASQKKKAEAPRLTLPRQPEESPENPLPELTYVAQRILQDHANGKPMHYKNIAAKAINAGWALPLDGAPAETLYAQVITEIKRRNHTGEPQRFVRYKNGFLGLSAWNDHDIAGLVFRQNQKLADEIDQRLQRLPAEQCQTLLTRILAETGFEQVIFTPPESHAKPFTVSAVYTAAGLFDIPVVILVTPMETPVSIEMVNGLKDALDPAERGLIIATSAVPKDAADAARDGHITIVTTQRLANVMIENSICVRKNPVLCCDIDNDELPDR